MKKSRKEQKIKKLPKMEKNTGKITKNMLLGELIQKYPKAAEVLMNEGIHCVGCGGAAFETIEQGLLLHGKRKKQIDEIIEKMNNEII